FEAADVSGDPLRDEVENFGRDVIVERFSLAAENGGAGVEIGGLDVDDQSALKAGNEAIFEFRDFADRTVAGEDDLFLGDKEVVEGVEELFLDPLFSAEKVDVVDQKDVDAAIALPEFRERGLLNGGDVLVGKFFG